jgi:hypothetical protein
VQAGHFDLHGAQQVSTARFLNAWHPALIGEHTHLMMAPMQPHLATVAQQPRHDMHIVAHPPRHAMHGPNSPRVQLETHPVQLETHASQPVRQLMHPP